MDKDTPWTKRVKISYSVAIKVVFCKIENIHKIMINYKSRLPNAHPFYVFKHTEKYIIVCAIFGYVWRDVKRYQKTCTQKV